MRVHTCLCLCGWVHGEESALDSPLPWPWSISNVCVWIWSVEMERATSLLHNAGPTVLESVWESQIRTAVPTAVQFWGAVWGYIGCGRRGVFGHLPRNLPKTGYVHLGSGNSVNSKYYGKLFICVHVLTFISISPSLNWWLSTYVTCIYSMCKCYNIWSSWRMWWRTSRVSVLLMRCAALLQQCMTTRQWIGLGCLHLEQEYSYPFNIVSRLRFFVVLKC